MTIGVIGAPLGTADWLLILSCANTSGNRRISAHCHEKTSQFLIDETITVHIQSLISLNEQEKREDIDDKAEKEMADTG
jgi:hypothetical protein